MERSCRATTRACKGRYFGGIPLEAACVWVTHIVTLGGYLHRSHREHLALPREAYSPFAWWSTMDGNRRGHDVSNPYSLDRVGAGAVGRGVGMLASPNPGSVLSPRAMQASPPRSTPSLPDTFILKELSTGK